MPKILLTDVTVQRLKPGLYFDSRTPSFGIRVGANRRSWLVVRGPNRTKVSLGRYPEVSVKEAHRKAMLALAAPAVRMALLTFPEARDAFLAQGKWRYSSRRALVSSLKHFTWTKNIGKITHEDVRQALEAIEHPSARAHALKDIRALFNFLVPRFLPSSPCVGIKMQPQRPRERVLSDDEIKRIWAATADAIEPFGTIVRLLLLTGQRRSEIAKLQWDYVGEDRITLPGEFVKNGRVHVFPLTPLVRSLLPERGTGLVFPAPGLDVPYAGFAYHQPKLFKASGTSGWTMHDLRRTCATNLAALNVPIHVTEKLLNHVSGSISGIAAVYNRHAYFDEMRAALEAWEGRLQNLVAG